MAEKQTQHIINNYRVTINSSNELNNSYASVFDNDTKLLDVTKGKTAAHLKREIYKLTLAYPANYLANIKTLDLSKNKHLGIEIIKLRNVQNAIPDKYQAGFKHGSMNIEDRYSVIFCNNGRANLHSNLSVKQQLDRLYNRGKQLKSLISEQFIDGESGGKGVIKLPKSQKEWTRKLEKSKKREKELSL